jgi:hypothetical protein|tara:strand:+ start:1279 stop:1944 length:666 start_codon:yes stop_codon:yes gene_type:complete
VPFEQIEITPLIATGTGYLEQHVIFGMTEFQMPAKDCMLLGGFVLDDSGTLDSYGQDGEANAHKINNINLHFFQNHSSTAGGPQEYLADGSNVNADKQAMIKANNYLGSVHVMKHDFDDDASGTETPVALIKPDVLGFDLPRIFKLVPLGDNSVNTSSTAQRFRQGNDRIMGLTSTELGNKMFCLATIDELASDSGTTSDNDDVPNFTAQGQIRILLSLEY